MPRIANSINFCYNYNNFLNKYNTKIWAAVIDTLQFSQSIILRIDNAYLTNEGAQFGVMQQSLL